MKYFLFPALLTMSLYSHAQELYIYTEPASNIPAKSVSAKLSANYIHKDNHIGQRYTPAAYIGMSKKWMLKAAATFADMNTAGFRYESFALYSKYRFLSKDDAHKHFRMAAFIDGAVSRSPYRYEEISLTGDKTGMEAGIVATQLVHKLAISGTVSHTQVLDKSRFDNEVVYNRPYQSMNYTLSAGYLLLPGSYKDYKQTNLNLYAEFLAQQTLDKKRYFVDMAPGLQLIFNSNTKLNLGCRFQLSGDMSRMARSSFLLSCERTFFNALK
ncbi:MAG: hypothetical protein QM640_01130 [Niabella sp.]